MLVSPVSIALWPSAQRSATDTGIAPMELVIVAKVGQDRHARSPLALTTATIMESASKESAIVALDLRVRTVL